MLNPGTDSRPAGSTDPGTPRVLVVDDDESIRMLVTRVLRRGGYDLDEAVDGADAIEKLRGAVFDALVLDLMMPRVDGFGVIAHLAETNPRMVGKTVIITAFPREAAKGRLHEVCCIVSKPFDVDELRKQVEQATGR